MYTPSNDLRGIHRKRTELLPALHNHIFSCALDKGHSLSRIHRMPTQVPRGNLHELVPVMILDGVCWVGQLVDIVPERILAARNGMPPSIDPLPVELNIFEIILELES